MLSIIANLFFLDNFSKFIFESNFIPVKQEYAFLLDIILSLSFSVANSFSIKYLKSLKQSLIFNNNLEVKVSGFDKYSKKEM